MYKQFIYVLRGGVGCTTKSRFRRFLGRRTFLGKEYSSKEGR